LCAEPDCGVLPLLAMLASPLPPISLPSLQGTDPKAAERELEQQYGFLLTSQLEAQRAFFEGQFAEAAQRHVRDSTSPRTSPSSPPLPPYLPVWYLDLIWQTHCLSSIFLVRAFAAYQLPLGPQTLLRSPQWPSTCPASAACARAAMGCYIRSRSPWKT